MFKQVYDPVSGSLGLTTIFAVLPLVTLFVLLGGLRRKAASVALVANTAPVAFGAIAVPITTLATVSGQPQDDLGSMVGRQTPLLALVVPLILVAMVDGRRGLRQTWPAALVAGFAFAVGQFVCSNYISVELTDIVASLLSAGALVAFLRIWQPGETMGGAQVPVMAGGAVDELESSERPMGAREAGDGGS